MVPLNSITPSMLASEPINVEIRSVFFSFFMVIAYPPNNSDICDLLEPDIEKAERLI
jgi:hypothetical protein